MKQKTSAPIIGIALITLGAILLVIIILPKPITNFEECVAAGNIIIKTLPRQCESNGQTFVEESNGQTRCLNSQRNAEVCAEIYAPVCGWSDPEKIQCIRYPCASTYENSCQACANEQVLYYTQGTCPQ